MLPTADKARARRADPRWLIPAVTLIAAVVAVALWRLQNVSDSEADAIPIGGPFELMDHHGRMVTEQDYAGKFLLVFFGYTYCPDICPTTLQTVAVALDALGEGGERVQPLFVSVDSARDTPQVLAGYVELFHPQIVGLTGSAEQIKAAAKAYRVFYARVAEEDSEDYLMDHSSIVYLMGPEGRFLTHFSSSTGPETIAATLRRHLDEA